ncbi:MAG: EamA family transporter [Lentisphaerae bacterium]|nr:EamA family transporter [Lentisphaerota bacterium]
MLILLVASVVWAFSFGLIKHKLLAVGWDPFGVAFARLVLSALLFLPFLRPATLTRRLAGQLLLLGAIQYGVMYVSYMWSYTFLAAHEVALFTIFTPLYVTLFDDAVVRRFRPRLLLTALLAVIGTGVVLASGPSNPARLEGILLLQVSNLCFAFGQVAYRRILGAQPALGPAGTMKTDASVFSLLFLGGALFAAVPALPVLRAGLPPVTMGQVATLLYLGLVPSGLCFFLWNAGARRTPTGTLAAMNNAKVPLGVLVSLMAFGESASLGHLVAGAALLAAAVWIGERGRGVRLSN